MQFPDAKIIVFARAPIAGQVKTRLGQAVGMQAACDLYKKLLERTFTTALNADLAPVCCYTTDPSHEYFVNRKTRGVGFYRQQGDDLGQRMLHAFSQQLATASSVLLIGSDCPVLAEEHLKQALVLLRDDSDTVIGPAEDGGYVLLGLKQAYAELFQGIDWGSDRVLQQTIHKIEQLQLQWQQLELLWDLDTEADYKRWLELQAITHTPAS